MNLNFSFALTIREEYKNKDLTDQKIINEINQKIANHLLNWKNGDTYSKIYLMKCSGMKNFDIAKECGITPSVVADRLLKLHVFLNYSGLEMNNLKILKLLVGVTNLLKGNHKVMYYSR